MDHKFRWFLAVLATLLLLQLIVNILISTSRSKSLRDPSATTYGSTIPEGQLVTGESRRLGKKKNTEALTIWSLLSRDAFAYLRTLYQGKPLPICPAVPSNLVGLQQNSYSLLSYKRLAELHTSLEPGGLWRPGNCTARHRVAVVVPYRDRDDHLRIFLNNIHPFLQRQQIDYGIYIVEQSSRGSFNRGMLLNIGYIESLRLYDYDCFIFHDVDLLPEDDRNLYWCPAMPRHMSAAVDTLFYKLPYRNLFGGVEAFTKEHFELINGFSNQYFGWGGEDDDLFQRLIFHNLNLTRYPLSIARYKMLRHLKMNPNPKRLKLLEKGPERFEEDGLNSLRYVLRTIEKRKLFTWIFVDIDEDILSSAQGHETTSKTKDLSNDNESSSVIR